MEIGSKEGWLVDIFGSVVVGLNFIGEFGNGIIVGWNNGGLYAELKVLIGEKFEYIDMFVVVLFNLGGFNNLMYLFLGGEY